MRVNGYTEIRVNGLIGEHCWRMLASINAAADAYVWADEDYKGRVRTAAIKLGGWALALLEDQADDDVERPHPTKPWVISSNPHMSRW